VVADLKLKLKKNWTSGQTALQRFNTAFLRDTDKLNEFKIALNNRFQALQDLLNDEETTMEDNWKSIKEELTSTYQEVLGLKKHHHKEWISTETLDRIKERKNKKTAVDNSRTRTEKFQAQAEPDPMNPPNIEAAHTDPSTDVNPPTKEKIRMAIRQIKIGKSAGPNNIPAEALKSDTKVTTNMLHLLFKKIWEEEQVPMDWKEEHLIKIPKKGDLIKYENYRGITLLSVPGKVFNRVLLNRMKDAVDAKLRDQQVGFCKDRLCTDHIATLRIIVEQSVEWNSSLYINFIDCEKAFDSVDRRTLWKLLRHYGFSEKIVNIIRNSYDRLQCKLVHGGQLTDAFQIRTGVRQDCLLSPFLFLLVVDWIMKTSTSERQHGIQWTAQNQLDDLDLADDLALLSHTHEQMQIRQPV
ncbi:unnamed protein product, partial [Schistosoma curassoni]|uniref:Reverse transcriptase domain-containing protein n=1 Tax=Schistosoma curassoni TaxID=6186 RepID=A0A183JTU6_9TREM